VLSRAVPRRQERRRFNLSPDPRDRRQLSTGVFLRAAERREPRTGSGRRDHGARGSLCRDQLVGRVESRKNAQPDAAEFHPGMVPVTVAQAKPSRCPSMRTSLTCASDLNGRRADISGPDPGRAIHPLNCERVRATTNEER